MKVLVVEDEVDLARALYQALEEDGYSVDVARDGEAGLCQARSGTYDALVLDLTLPRKDGVSVLHDLRQGGSTTPVLVLTARDSLADKVRGLDEGADDYLTKPFEFEELLARLRSLIRRAAGQPTPLLHLGPVAIDTVAGVVRKEGATVDLTPKEYALIELLARNRGKLVSRTMIYEHIYAEDDDSLSNVLDVYISNLRKKLGKELITTRRGLGYMVDV